MERNFITAQQIADCIGGVVFGDEEKRAYGISLPEDSTEETLTYFDEFVSSQKSNKAKFAFCIVPIRYHICDDRTYIVVNCGIYEILHVVVDFLVDQKVCRPCRKIKDDHETIGKNTVISDSAKIGDNCLIGDHVSIASAVTIGRNCHIGAHVVIESGVIIGNGVHIQSGAVIGCDSFEYAEEHGYQKITNLGTVVIEDNVVIGANTTIARGTIGNTVIGSGTVIDNLVQIGHEVVVGQECKICSQCGLAGWAVLEDYVTLYGKVGVSNHVVIERGAVVLGMSGVTKRVRSGEIVAGNPARRNKQYLSEQAMINRLAKRGAVL